MEELASDEDLDRDWKDCERWVTCSGVGGIDDDDSVHECKYSSRINAVRCHEERSFAWEVFSRCFSHENGSAVSMTCFPELFKDWYHRAALRRLNEFGSVELCASEKRT